MGTKKQFVFTVPVFGGLQKEVTINLYYSIYSFFSEVCSILNYRDATNVLALHIFDRILYTTYVRKAAVPALGCACMLIACKMEEVVVSHINALIYLVFSVLLVTSMR